jgi:hypothetical protein
MKTDDKTYELSWRCKFLGDGANSAAELADKLEAVARDLREMAAAGVELEMSDDYVMLTTADPAVAERFGFEARVWDESWDPPNHPPYEAVPDAKLGGWDVVDARGVKVDYCDTEEEAQALVRDLDALASEYDDDDAPYCPPYEAVAAPDGGWDVRDARGVAVGHREREEDAQAGVRRLNATTPGSHRGRPEGRATRLDRSWAGKLVSSGTMRKEVLIPAFESVLRQAGVAPERPAAVGKLLGGREEGLTSDEWSEVISYLIENLQRALEAVAPEGCYFGTYPANGKDFGFHPYCLPFAAVPMAHAKGWEVRDARGVTVDCCRHKEQAELWVAALNAAPPEGEAR